MGARITFAIDAAGGPTTVEVAGAPTALPTQDELVEVIGTAAELAFAQADGSLELANVSQKVMERLTAEPPAPQESQR